MWEATKSAVAKEALDRIAAVYAIEAVARGKPSNERIAIRTKAKPLLDEFFGWSHSTLSKLSAKSALAEAFRYTLKRQVGLSRFLCDGRLEADNNRAENSLRGVALGRNYAHQVIMRRSPREGACSVGVPAISSPTNCA